MNDSLESVVHEAGSAYSEGRFEEARQLYESALLKHPNNGILHANLSAILLKINIPELSLQHSETAVQLCPNWAKAHYRRGESLRAIGRKSEAILAFCQGIYLDPNNFQILKSLSDLISAVYVKFPWEHLKLLKLDQDVATILATLGQMILAENRYESAIQVLKFSLELELKSVKLQESVFGSLTAAYCDVENYEDALVCAQKQLETAIRIDADSVPKIRESLAIIAEMRGNYDVAIFQQKILAVAGNKKSISTLWELYLKSGNAQKILNEVENSGKFEDVILIGKAHALKGDHKKALATLIPLSRDPKNQCVELISTINKSMLELDDLTSSSEFLQKMISENSKNWDLILHCYCLLCQTQITAESLENALKTAKLVMKLARKSENWQFHEANAFRLLAIIYEHQKDVGSAFILWKKYLESKILTGNEKVNGWLQVARLAQNETINEPNVGRFFENSIREAKRPCEKVVCLSAKYRFLLNSAKLANAKEVLEVLKSFLDGNLDSKTRSIIFEDVALFDENGQGSNEKEQLLALEQSLTEAQHANETHREAAILEKIGHCLRAHHSPRNLKLAEKYYCQQLEVGRELKNAQLMADAFCNVAGLKFDEQQFESAAEHARNALTVFKLSSDNPKKVQMLVLLAKCEFQLGNLEVAESAAEKAQNLAEDCELNPLLAVSCRLLAEIYRKSGKSEDISMRFVRKHIDLFEFEPEDTKKFESLRDFLEFVVGRRNWRVGAVLSAILRLHVEDSQLLEIVEILSNAPKLSGHCRSILEFLLNRKTSDSENLEKILEKCRIFPDLLFDFFAKNREIVETFPNFHVDLQILGFPMEKTTHKLLEILEKKNSKSISLQDLENFPLETQSRIFDIFYEDFLNFPPNLNRIIDCHVAILTQNLKNVDFLDENLRDVEKILCAAHLDERNLIEMWFFEFLEKFKKSPGQSPIIDRYLRGGIEENLKFAAIFTALSVGGKLKILEILESCEIALMSKKLSEFRGSAVFDKLKFSKIPLAYSFKVGSVSVVFEFATSFDDYQVFWSENSKVLSFFDAVLIRFLQSFGFPRRENLAEFAWKNRFFISDFDLKEEEEEDKSIDIFSFVRLGALADRPLICARKLENCHVAIVDSEKFSTFLDVFSSGMRQFPRYLIVINGIKGINLSTICLKILEFANCQVIPVADERVAAVVAKNIVSECSPRSFISTIRNDLKIAIDGDYCIPDTNLAAKIDEFGKLKMLEILSFEKLGTVEINQKIRGIEEEKLRKFCEFIYSDHYFDEKTGIREEDFREKSLPKNYGVYSVSSSEMVTNFSN